MRGLLSRLLACPTCGGPFRCVPFEESAGGTAVEQGLLLCGCGAGFPIVDSIPRIVDHPLREFPRWRARYGAEVARHGTPLDGHPGGGALAGDTERAQERTRRSFGYQWSAFSEMVCDFRENFLNYIDPVGLDFFPEKVGLDAGVGFGRHIYHAASFGAEMVGMDLSVAVDSARLNSRHLERVHLVQGDIYRPPFRPETFDFVYSIGVLHHLPDPTRGFRSLERLVKPGGAFLVWLYSDRRRVSNRLLESLRSLSTRLPHPLLRLVTLGAALVDWAGFIAPYRVLRSAPLVGRLVERLAFERVKNYSRYPFQVVWADWFDRLGAPIRFYYNEATVAE
ncbi:MAG: methyltransferase domain-containing protein, partial [Candidatus Rokubacteria bacterium]|nr:methyltransferase domain-containing protein [Candidatus Rokubacteria bacterium]